MLQTSYIVARLMYDCFSVWMKTAVIHDYMLRKASQEDNFLFRYKGFPVIRLIHSAILHDLLLCGILG